MLRRRVFCAAIALAIPMLSLCGCSHDMPTSSTGADVDAVRHGLAVRSAAEIRGVAVAILLPKALASVRVLPELGIREGGGGYGDAHSSYSRTTDANREFRRGFAEFAIPGFSEGVFGARIVLRETRAWTSWQSPPDRHELSTYTDADLVVSTSDYDRRATLIGTFETDANEDTRTFEFDVSRLVAQSLRANLGFRVKLEADPAQTGFVNMGTAFNGSSTPAGVSIEVTTTVTAAIDHLQSMVGEMIEGQVLSPRMKDFVLRHLQQAEDLLRDDNPHNDRGACGNLSAIIDEVDRTFWRGEGMAAPEASYITQSALNLKASIGCSGTRRARLPEGRQSPIAPERRGVLAGR